jgi:hypothetical protein
MAKKKSRPAIGGVSREEFSELARFVDDIGRNLELQFKRIAQIQAELDIIRAAWTKAPSSRRRPRPSQT